MSVVRSPTGSGLAAGRSGSQPNLVSGDSHLEFADSARITLRNKRKQTDDDSHIKDELSEIRKQLSQMMEMMTALNRNQKEYMENMSRDILVIKEEINEIKNVTNNLTTDQSSVKSDILCLKNKATETEKKIETLAIDVVQLKDSVSLPSSASSLESMMIEIKEREDRSKNVIIIGVPEVANENRDDRN